MSHHRFLSFLGYPIVLTAVILVGILAVYLYYLQPVIDDALAGDWCFDPETKVKLYDNSIVKNETNNTLIKAINTMRCFTTPGCYPSIKCLDGKPSMKIGVPHKWEHHSFCNSDMEKVKDNCLIYSFGLDKNIEWEKRMAKKYGCDVFGFDPTSNFPENAAEGVKFHKLGLVGAGVSARALADTHSILYDEIDPTQL